MDFYRTVGFANPSPAQVDDYGGGLFRLRHIKPTYQGKLIFFAAERAAGSERLVVLTVYKKESQNVPKTVLDRARSRPAEYMRRSRQ
jgi:hypothetical protein